MSKIEDVDSALAHPKRCPFCGGFAVLEKRDESLMRYRCALCGAAGAYSDSEEGAMAKWNIRQIPRARIMYESFRKSGKTVFKACWCSACEGRGVLAHDRYCHHCGAKFTGKPVEVKGKE